MEKFDSYCPSGGNDAVIVCEDVDVAAVAQAVSTENPGC